MTIATEPEYSRKAALVCNSQHFLSLPPDQQFALREAFGRVSSEEELPAHLRELFADDVHGALREAAFREWQHPRGRGGRWRSILGRELSPHELTAMHFLADQTHPSRPGRKEAADLARHERMTLRVEEPRSTMGWARTLSRLADRGLLEREQREGAATYRVTPDAADGIGPEPGDLIRGRQLGKRKGRKGLRRPAKGWLEYARAAHEQPVLRQGELKEKYRAMQAGFGSEAPHVPTGEKKKADLLTVGDRIEVEGQVWEVSAKSEFEVTIRPVLRQLGQRPWTLLYRRSPSEYVLVHPDQEAVTRARAEWEKFSDEWWGVAGSGGFRGKYQRPSGDPGVEFEAQHERILEVGARIDAEVKRKTRMSAQSVRDAEDAKKAVQQRARELDEAMVKERYRITREEAVKLGYLELTDDQIFQRRVYYMKENAKKNPNQAILHANADWDFLYWTAQSDELTRMQQERHDVADRITATAAEEREARRVLAGVQRDVAYQLLGKVREFGPSGARLQFDARSPELNTPMIRAMQWVPSDWVRASNRHESELVVVGYVERGQYQSKAPVLVEALPLSKIALSASPAGATWEEGEGTALHELVHRAEHVVDGLKGAEWAFYASRVSPGTNREWEDTQPMREATGISSYRENEKTRVDSFLDAYAGKTYGDQMDSMYEILTMGVEDLVTNEHGMLQQDEEYRQFVYGALALL